MRKAKFLHLLFMALMVCFTMPVMAGSTPLNDECAGATTIECGDVIFGTTIEATIDDGEVGDCGFAAVTSPGVWHYFAGIDGMVTFSTCDAADFDSKISVYSGACGALTCIDGNDDGPGCSGFTSELTVTLSSGTDYYVLVHGFGGDEGDYTLTVTCEEETNDVCGGSLAIGCDETVSGTTVGSTFDDAGFCDFTNTSDGVWYHVIPGFDGAVSATTCSPNTNFDTKLSVYEGTCDALACVVGNDDDFSCLNSIFQSTVTWNVTTGTTYFVLVHGFGTATGDFELTTTCVAAAPNNMPCNAEALTLGVPTAFDNTGSTADADEVSPGAGSEPGNTCNSQDGWCSFETEVQNSVWYTFVAPASGAVSAQADALDYQIAVYDVELCFDFGSYSTIAANDDSGPLFAPYAEAYCLTPGETYYVQVDGFDGTAGPGTVLVADLGGAPLSCDAGDCQTKYVGYEPAEGLNHLIVTPSGGNPPYFYSWSGDGIISDPNRNHITVAPEISTTYTATVTDGNGCTTECSVDVNVVDLQCGRNNSKIWICHRPPGNPDNAQQLCISENAVDAHLSHHDHDSWGFCDNECNATNPPPPEIECVPFVVEILTDDFAGETSWEITDVNGGFVIASGAPGSLPSATSTTLFDECVEPGCYAFTIFDEFGDGICCGFGIGEYTVSYGGDVTIGGDFGFEETVVVGDCEDRVNNQTPLPQEGFEPINNERVIQTDVSAFPNPFSENTRINVVPVKNSNATIDILHLNGRVIATLFDGQVYKGQTIEQDVSGEMFPSSGIYIYRVRIGDETFTDKLIITK